jgi:hypothetical protein
MVERIKQWLAEGKEVRVFTARVYEPMDCSGMAPEPISKKECRKIIEEWCIKHIGQKLPITCQKDYGMIELWDDRCVQVIPNTGIAIQDILQVKGS